MDPLNFYDKLYQSKEFCEQLGRILLGFNKLEVFLKDFLRSKSFQVSEMETFGQLIGKLEGGRFLSESGQIHFQQLLRVRNYLTHNFYAGFCGQLDSKKKLLESDGLSDMDAEVFESKLKQEVENIESYIVAVKRALFDPENSLELL